MIEKNVEGDFKPRMTKKLSLFANEEETKKENRREKRGDG